MAERRTARIFLSIFGWLLIACAGWVACDEYVTRHEAFSSLMENFIWRTVTVLAVVGFGLVIWAWRLRLRDRN